MTTSVESHIDDLFFDVREATVVSRLQHERTVRTVRLLAAIALCTDLRVAAFDDDLITVTIGARHGNEYHGHLLSMVESPWHTSQ
jgi:hypothetical protein